jgi:hypothetical protein
LAGSIYAQALIEEEIDNPDSLMSFTSTPAGSNRLTKRRVEYMEDFLPNQDRHASNPFTNHDHCELISLVNQLQEAVCLGHATEILETTLNELIRYTEEHLKREDAPMPKTPYPGPAAQPMGHDKCHWITA